MARQFRVLFNAYKSLYTMRLGILLGSHPPTGFAEEPLADTKKSPRRGSLVSRPLIFLL